MNIQKNREVSIPADIRSALAKDVTLYKKWNDLTALARRDFIRWIVSAKQKETRKRRIVIACSKLVAGKRRACCYAVVPMVLYKALGENPKAKANWSLLSADRKRDYGDWVEGASDPAQRELRSGIVCRRLLGTQKSVQKLPEFFFYDKRTHRSA
jgi:uncharacterized protein YdeI (YjbR/CyaY-like superfamily)